MSRRCLNQDACSLFTIFIPHTPNPTPSTPLKLLRRSPRFIHSPPPTLETQIQTLTAELAEAQGAATAAAASPSAAHTNTAANANSDGFDGETAETSSELRRLRVELDRKGSELDTAMKEHETVRAELKEMKDMLSAAASAVGAAGADEDSLRKRVSQLACENGLLKGEKDRQESLAAEARAEARSNASRSAAEVERLEREVERLSGVAGKASLAAEDGDRARAALSAMEARLSEVRQERAELQVRHRVSSREFYHALQYSTIQYSTIQYSTNTPLFFVPT